MFERAGHVAGFLFETLLQETEADRVNTFFQLSLRAGGSFIEKTQHSINYEIVISFVKVSCFIYEHLFSDSFKSSLKT